MPPPAVDPAAVRRLLVARLDNVGDVVMLSPALRALRAALPGASITLLASPGGSQVAPLLPWVDEVIVLRSLWQDLHGALAFDPQRELDLVERLRAPGYDAALVFTSFSQSPHPLGYLLYLAGVPVRIGQSREFAGGVLSHTIAPRPDEEHQAERNLALVTEGAGLPAAGAHLEVRVPGPARQRAEDLLGPGDDVALVLPGASAASRRWSAEGFGRAARGLAERAGLRPVVVGTSKEAALVAATVAASGGAATALATETSVPELAALVERSALVLCNNSGGLHLADALERPLVVLFSGTDQRTQWEPRRAPSAVLGRTVACAPCRLFACPIPGHPCLRVEPEEVVAAALGVLGAAGT